MNEKLGTFTQVYKYVIKWENNLAKTAVAYYPFFE